MQRREINHLEKKIYFKILAYLNNNNINTCYILCSFYALITLLSAFCLTCIIALDIPIDRCYYFHFTNDETEIEHFVQGHTTSDWQGCHLDTVLSDFEDHNLPPLSPKIAPT